MVSGAGKQKINTLCRPFGAWIVLVRVDLGLAFAVFANEP
jgi:hypothetical protein